MNYNMPNTSGAEDDSSCQYDDQGTKLPKTIRKINFEDQIDRLKEEFERNPYPNWLESRKLADEMGLTEKEVEMRFIEMRKQGGHNFHRPWEDSKKESVPVEMKKEENLEDNAPRRLSTPPIMSNNNCETPDSFAYLNTPSDTFPVRFKSWHELITLQQSFSLEKAYRQTQNPSNTQVGELAHQIKVTKALIELWFEERNNGPHFHLLNTLKNASGCSEQDSNISGQTPYDNEEFSCVNASGTSDLSDTLSDAIDYSSASSPISGPNSTIDSKHSETASISSSLATDLSNPLTISPDCSFSSSAENGQSSTKCSNHREITSIDSCFMADVSN